MVEQIDETGLWLELFIESGIVSGVRLKDLLREANELLAIFVTSQMTAKGIASNAGARKFVSSQIRQFAIPAPAPDIILTNVQLCTC